ncbi:hypothetical protein BST61_g11054 [Cercospora zeina]
MINTTWTAPSLWTLSCIILVIYVLTLFPIAYIFYKHKKRGLQAWIQLSIFVILQLAGHGIIAGVGQGSAPPFFAPVLASIALSPLMVGTAAVLHEWFTTTRVAHVEKNAVTAQWLLNAFHLIGIFALGQILGGEILLGQGGAPPYARPLLQSGAFLLSVLFLCLCFATFVLWWRHSQGSSSPLIWSVLIALPFVGLRYVYEVVTAWDAAPELDQIFGSLTYRAALQVVPQTIALLILIVGAVLARNVNEDMRLGHHELIEEPSGHAVREEQHSKG